MGLRPTPTTATSRQRTGWEGYVLTRKRLWVGAGGMYLGIVAYVAAGESWYYAPQPGKRSMVMTWPMFSLALS